MEELIAKKYVKALQEDFDIASLEAVSGIFSAISESFKDEKFVNIMANSNVSAADKEAILLAAVQPASSEKLNNFVKLLVENKRIAVIPAVAVELEKEIANATKTYEGTVYSDSPLDSDVIANLGNGLGQKFNSTISLNFVQNDFNGIKVSVDGLGVEINFSKDRINNQLIQHILKAI